MGYVLLMHPTNRIRELRKRSGLSQAELGERLGLSPGQVSHLENGARNLTLEWMKRIARALDVSVVDLLTAEDNPDRLADDERRVVQAMRNSDEMARQHIQAMAAAISEISCRDPGRRLKDR